MSTNHPLDLSITTNQNEDKDTTIQNKDKDTTIFIKFVKLCLIVLIFVFVFISAIVSKSMFIAMASLISVNDTEIPHECNNSHKIELMILNVNVYEMVKNCNGIERSSWIWCIFIIIIVPELLTFVNCVGQSMCRGRQGRQGLTMSSTIIILIMETVHVIGVVILVFILFPLFDVITCVAVTNCLSILPAIFRIFSRSNDETKLRIKYTIDVLALLSQIACTIMCTTMGVIAGVAKSWLIPLVAIFVSFGWWENYVRTESKIGIIKKLAQIKEELYKERVARNFTYIFISIWKMFVIFLTMIISLYISDGNDLIKQMFTSVSFTPKSECIIDHSFLLSPLPMTIIQIFSTLICYAFAVYACKIHIQFFAFAFPLIMVVPLSGIFWFLACNQDFAYGCQLAMFSVTCPKYAYHLEFDKISITQYSIWILSYLSQLWFVNHIFKSKCERLASIKKLFMSPSYFGAMIDLSLFHNRRHDDIIDKENQKMIPKIHICATMWHENNDEMQQLIMSLIRMDEDQCSREESHSEYYTFDAHIFFDSAFDEKESYNEFATQLIAIINKLSDKFQEMISIKTNTPYGQRIQWKMLNGNDFYVHLKNSALIRHKKRWSQVMYMYYLIDHLIPLRANKEENKSKLMSTYILALDGDINFQPKAVSLLVDLMKKKEILGAACGRIHPMGSGPMFWYQKFEYAIGHWLQKATEHVFGCVLCSPGCFSLFRAKALADVMRKYVTKSEEALHYVQYDQGEDRWLSTLLLKHSYLIEYCAAADAYTHCPESFKEFYVQRLRWIPSTIANVVDLLKEADVTVKINNNISRWFIAYQILMMIGTILGPGTIFLMLCSAMTTAFDLSAFHAFIYLIIPIIFFIIICFQVKNNDTQIMIAQLLSALFALLMMAVFVSILIEMIETHLESPPSMLFIVIMSSFAIVALLHPQEISIIFPLCHIWLYLLLVPSMYLLLIIYSFVNMNNVNWGTRETSAADKNRSQSYRKDNCKYALNLFNWAKCLFCIYAEDDKCNEQETLINQQQEPMQYQASTSKDTRYLTSLSNTTIRDSDDSGMNDNEKTTSANDNEMEQHDTIISVNARDNRSIIAQQLDEGENKFWIDLINDYLYPLAKNEEKERKMKQELIKLRNNVTFLLFIVNSLFVLLVLLLQKHKDVIYILWPFTVDGKEDYAKIEPMGLVLLFFLIAILALQFICMLIHRFDTFSHLMASTTILSKKNASQHNKINADINKNE